MRIEKIEQLFDLTIDDKKTLDVLSDNPTSINQIYKETKIFQSIHLGSRHSVKNKIYGTKYLAGLLPLEYLFEKKRKLQSTNRLERVFFLTLKGNLSLIESGKSIEKIYAFHLFFKLISRNVKNQNVQKIIKEYIVNQIQYFLIWHKIRGIKLTLIKNFKTYYDDFVKIKWETSIEDIPIDQLGSLKKSFEDKALKYVTSIKLIKKLEKNTELPSIEKRVECLKNRMSPNTNEDISNTHKINRERLNTKQISLIDVIHKWYQHIDDIQFNHELEPSSITSENLQIGNKTIQEMLELRNKIEQKSTINAEKKLPI